MTLVSDCCSEPARVWRTMQDGRLMEEETELKSGQGYSHREQKDRSTETRAGENKNQTAVAKDSWTKTSTSIWLEVGKSKTAVHSRVCSSHKYLLAAMER